MPQRARRMQRPRRAGRGLKRTSINLDKTDRRYLEELERRFGEPPSVVLRLALRTLFWLYGSRGMTFLLEQVQGMRRSDE